MSVFNSITAGELTNAHGEVNFFRVTEGKIDLAGFEEVVPESGGYVVGHSETGHHHVLEAEGVTVMHKRESGMDILYAIVRNPTMLKQTAGSPHAEQIVEPGEYIVTNNVDYDPFTEQARRVAD